MILCCGEALVDMLPRQGACGQAQFAPHAGGAALNTAIALGRLGGETGIYAGLSTDRFGTLLCDTLTASNVDMDLANISDRLTTLAFVHLVDGHPSYAFHDENTAGRMLGIADLPVLDDNVKALQFAGISLATEPCGTTFETLMAREHGHRVLMIDPNIRPAFIKNRDEHLARMNRMMAMADIVKLSDEDLKWFGYDGTIDEIAARILDGGPSVVFVTRGGDGASAYGRGGQAHVPSRRVEVVDTVAAGDTFNAAVLSALADRDLLSRDALTGLDSVALTEILDFAARAAAITVSRAGANPPWRDEIL